jgi:hypothetical protein
VSLSGCGDTRAAEVIWPDVQPGEYQVYAVVDVDGVVPEVTESNNLIRSTVRFYDQVLYAPLVTQGRATFAPVD